MSEAKHDIERADIDFWIHSGETRLGHLHISRGGIGWFEGKSFKNKRSYNWDDLAGNLDKALAALNEVFASAVPSHLTTPGYFVYEATTIVRSQVA